MIGFRQILVILGVIFLVRVIGKIMTARRQINEQKAYNKQQKSSSESIVNFGKTTISKVDKKVLKNEKFSPYEEVE